MPDLKTHFTNKNIVVTGGVGSVGREIVEKLLEFSPNLVRVVDNNESGLFDMEMSFAGHGNIEFYLADITDEREIRRTFSNMDMCFHSAALKHVPSCERSPFSAVNVNIQGCETVGRAAIEAGLEKVIFTSSDKAVNPTNVMGTTKLMGERLFTAMNFLRSQQHKTKFSCTRFGNVLGSRGSVVPLFANQIAKGGPITLTDDRMSRFVMTMSQAADLVIESMVLAKGGEVFITKMPVLRIRDLARVMIDRLAPLYGYTPTDIKVNTVGARPGEKMWEELSTEEEAGRLLEGEKFLVVLPAGHTRAQREQTYAYEEVSLDPSEVVYHSDRQPIMDDQQIADLLMEDAVLPSEVRTLVDSMQTGEQQ
ncbi:hypothetical protein OCH239_10105 [Roseivivax halodurans JCM 10272]|uniref:Polysaccharide biosynthesis protein CapD-like domain-containing protein n=2 Tax=Roseivivax halodurans TaxID=93683 RepID=X7EBL2_9RHOB|nr:hypothetical protein OCH239_10105 [Roseivivax halodurans JCM 10272]